MKSIIIIQLLIGILAGTAFAQSTAKIDLKQYRWKNRLILVFAPSATDSSYLKVKQKINQLNNQIIERDIVLFHLFENGKSFVGDSVLDKKSVDSLRKLYQVKPGKPSLILIGKDGGKKLRQQEVIDFKSIFDRIDAMPMRQLEMKQRQEE